MSRPRAADDFKTIRTRMEELRRQRLPEQPAPDNRHQRRGSSWPLCLWQELIPRRVRRIVQGVLKGTRLPLNAIRAIVSPAPQAVIVEVALEPLRPTHRRPPSATSKSKVPPSAPRPALREPRLSLTEYGLRASARGVSCWIEQRGANPANCKRPCP